MSISTFIFSNDKIIDLYFSILFVVFQGILNGVINQFLLYVLLIRFGETERWWHRPNPYQTTHNFNLYYVKHDGNIFEGVKYLRSKDANLILACGFPELVALCTVICRKTPHSCKDTKMATPLNFCRGMSRPVNWCRLILRHVITCDKTCGEHMSMEAGHASSTLCCFLWLPSIQAPWASLFCTPSVGS